MVVGAAVGTAPTAGRELKTSSIGATEPRLIAAIINLLRPSSIPSMFAKLASKAANAPVIIVKDCAKIPKLGPASASLIILSSTELPPPKKLTQPAAAVAAENAIIAPDNTTKPPAIATRPAAFSRLTAPKKLTKPAATAVITPLMPPSTVPITPPKAVTNGDKVLRAYPKGIREAPNPAIARMPSHIMGLAAALPKAVNPEDKAVRPEVTSPEIAPSIASPGNAGNRPNNPMEDSSIAPAPKSTFPLAMDLRPSASPPSDSATFFPSIFSTSLAPRNPGIIAVNPIAVGIRLRAPRNDSLLAKLFSPSAKFFRASFTPSKFPLTESPTSPTFFTFSTGDIAVGVPIAAPAAPSAFFGSKDPRAAPVVPSVFFGSKDPRAPPADLIPPFAFSPNPFNAPPANDMPFFPYSFMLLKAFPAISDIGLPLVIDIN